MAIVLPCPVSPVGRLGELAALTHRICSVLLEASVPRDTLGKACHGQGRAGSLNHRRSNMLARGPLAVLFSVSGLLLIFSLLSIFRAISVAEQQTQCAILSRACYFYQYRVFLE